ncbi:tRNA preQ1(34) S-adenosylmethionine ribosyltransferase-isomerase QueA [Patescibacteria group bacterium]|nr:tRNA preQ1(34) S-adenosylmethionine ribosyltransferase-isomerase QueA [Patescibacteria group bacterium]
MRLQEFDFHLPSHLIAQHPADPRDQARLLVYNRQTGEITHSTVADIGSFLPAGTVLTVNNSKVRQGRLYGVVGSKKVEVLVLEKERDNTYHCLIRGRNIPIGSRFSFAPAPLSAELLEKTDSPGITTYLLRFHTELPTVEEAFARFGHTPIPPYITAPVTSADEYQTVYARPLGSAAAPTAGLHFTTGLIAGLKAAGFGWEEITLHVGIGTFLPLRKERVEDNTLHSESTFIPPETADRLTAALHQNRPILAVGTTSIRTLESHFSSNRINPGWLSTQLFIYPGYAFHTANLLLTNFHLPRSSLLLLLAAFLGNSAENTGPVRAETEMIAELHRIYSEAIRLRYRFYSFGDAMLVQ